VFLADDTRLNRQVAVKIAHALQADGAATFYSRVMREGRAAAKLDHPHIVPIYEVAEHEDRPLIVGKFVEGVTLAERIKRGRFDPKKAVTMALQITSAVAYANGRGIIHRDLKPGNILVDSQDHPFVTDFGLAKYESVEESISGDSGYVGTPAYMSPEQAAGLSHYVDGRSDQYAIGVMLFEMLTGERPFRGNAKMLLHQVIFDDPPSPAKFVHTIPRDLETICLKCLQKDRERRYGTCDELAEELRRFLNGEPILARPISRAERIWRWCRQHRQIVGLTVACLVSLLIGLLGVSWQWLRAEANASNERAARQEADHANQLLEKQIAETQQLLYNSRLNLTETATKNGHYQQIEELLRPFAHDPSFKSLDFEYSYFRNLQRNLKQSLEHVESVGDMQFHPNGRFLAAAGLRTTMVFDCETGKALCSFRGHRGRVHRARFVPGTDLIATASEDGTVKFWSFETGIGSGPALQIGSPVLDLHVHGGSGRIALAHGNGQISVWNVLNRERVQAIDAHSKPATCVRFINGGRELVSGGEDEQVNIWKIETGELRLRLPTPSAIVSALDIQEEPTRIYAGFVSSQVRTWRDDGSIVNTLANSFVGPISCLTALDQGRYAISGFAGMLQVREAESRRLCFTIPTHVESFSRHAVSVNGQSFAAGGDDGRVKLFDLELSRYHDVTQVGSGELTGLQFLGEDRQWIGASEDGSVSLVIADHHSLSRSVTVSSDDGRSQGLRVSALARTHQPNVLCIGSTDGQVGYYHLEKGKWEQRAGGSQSEVTAICSLLQDQVVVFGCRDGTVRTWSRGEPTYSPPLHTHRDETKEITKSWDDQRAYSVGLDQLVFEINAATRNGSVWGTAMEPIHSIAIRRDDVELAVGLGNGEIQRWDLATKRPLPSLRGHVGPVQSLLYFPSHRTLGSGANDRHVRFWDLQSGETKIKEVVQHRRAIRRMALSADGTVLLTGDASGMVRQWDAPRLLKTEN
jgi:WD40 repeat protein